MVSKCCLLTPDLRGSVVAHVCIAAVLVADLPHLVSSMARMCSGTMLVGTQAWDDGTKAGMALFLVVGTHHSGALGLINFALLLLLCSNSAPSS